MHMFANLTGDTANATVGVAGVALESLQTAGSFLFQTASSYASNIIQQAPDLTEYLPTTSHDQLNQMDAAHREIYYVSFNQDSTSLGVGHEGGYHIYNMGSIENTNGSGLQIVHKSNLPEKTCIVERLFQSSLITFVSLNQSRKLQVYHYKLGNDICSHSYTTAVKAVRMNRKRVIVCLEESIHVHNIRDMRLLHMIRDTPTNKDGLIDLCSNDANCYLAYPGSATHGHVNIFDADPLVATCTIAAHEAPLSALRFNSDGSKLATASTKGTVIRVFAIPSGERLYEFTRGVKRCVQIHMLAFSYDSKYLCSSSNTETIHVFSLAKAEQLKQQALQAKTDENDQSLSSWVSYFSQQASNYLPTQMNELMLREKSYATARLPVVGSKTCCAIPRIGNRDYLAVASTDGYLFCYTIPPESGECTLARQYRIGPLADEEASEMTEGTKLQTTAKPIYPIIDHSGDTSTVGNIGSYGTSPMNRSPPLIPSSAPISQSPLSSSPVVKSRQKTVSQSSTTASGVLSGSPANTPTKAFATATIPAPKTKTRKNSSSSGSSIESADGSIGSGSSHEKKQEKSGPGNLNNFDEFPPLGDFD